jgi:UDP-glucose 4-epimerase
MNILVTGSSGTIGTRLCEELLARGDQVTGIDWAENKWNKKIEAITKHIDLRDGKAVAALVLDAPFHALIHLAANARVYELVKDPSQAKDNFLTTFNALELARRLEISRFVFASSRESYGNIDVPHYTEDLVRVENCESPYTASKIGGEALVSSYSRCYGVDHVIFRFSNVYGMYDESDRVVPIFIRKARKNEELTVFGEEKCLDFTYIDDAVGAIVKSIDMFEEVKNDTFNIAFGEGTTLVHLAEEIRKLLKSTSPIHTEPTRIGEITRYVANIEKAKEHLGYEPKTPFAAGIRKAVEWYLKHT